MRNVMLAVISAITFFSAFGPSANAADKKGNQIVGAVWEVKLKNAKENWVTAIRVRADRKGDVYYDGKQVGTHKRKGDQVILVLEDIPDKLVNLNGTYSVRPIRTDNKLYTGEFESENGKKIPVRLHLLAD
ncbi:MAG: hypothetical protein KDA69_08895 [Planctomycetaceae bacterium]|nr:hypothetical protein [Planctomycetaceae bacterium]MCA9044424.1 hypothetical protein [Planctomycetaceae bacterium]